MMSNASNTPTSKYNDVSSSALNFNIALNILTTCVAIPGNLLFLILFYKFKKLRGELNNVAITILSVTDLLRCSIVMTTKIHSQINRVKNIDTIACDVTAVVCAFSFVFCPLMLAFIAFVRYYKIVPHRYLSMSDRLFYKICVVLFLVAVLFAMLPYMHIGIYDYSHIHGVCFVDWSHKNRMFRIVFYSLSFFFAFPVLGYSYSKLYLALRQNNQRIEQHFKRNIPPEPVRSINPPTTPPVNENFSQHQSIENDNHHDHSLMTTVRGKVQPGFNSPGSMPEILADSFKSEEVSTPGRSKIGVDNNGYTMSVVDIDVNITGTTQKESSISDLQSNLTTEPISKEESDKSCLDNDPNHIISNEPMEATNNGFDQDLICTSTETFTNPNLRSQNDHGDTKTDSNKSIRDSNTEHCQDELAENKREIQDSSNNIAEAGHPLQLNGSIVKDEKRRNRSGGGDKDKNMLTSTHQCTPLSTPKIRKREEFKKASVKLEKFLVKHKHENHKHDYRVTQLLVIIFIAYLVCWLPGTILNVVVIYQNKKTVHINFWFYLIVTLEEMKSALDPLIYGLGNQKYRRAFCRLIQHWRADVFHSSRR